MNLASTSTNRRKDLLVGLLLLLNAPYFLRDVLPSGSLEALGFANIATKKQAPGETSPSKPDQPPPTLIHPIGNDTLEQTPIEGIATISNSSQWSSAFLKETTTPSETNRSSSAFVLPIDNSTVEQTPPTEILPSQSNQSSGVTTLPIGNGTLEQTPAGGITALSKPNHTSSTLSNATTTSSETNRSSSTFFSSIDNTTVEQISSGETAFSTSDNSSSVLIRPFGNNTVEHTPTQERTTPSKRNNSSSAQPKEATTPPETNHSSFTFVPPIDNTTTKEMPPKEAVPPQTTHPLGTPIHPPGNHTIQKTTLEETATPSEPNTSSSALVHPIDNTSMKQEPSVETQPAETTFSKTNHSSSTFVHKVDNSSLKQKPPEETTPSQSNDSPTSPTHEFENNALTQTQLEEAVPSKPNNSSSGFVHPFLDSCLAEANRLHDADREIELGIPVFSFVSIAPSHYPETDTNNYYYITFNTRPVDEVFSHKGTDIGAKYTSKSVRWYCNDQQTPAEPLGRGDKNGHSLTIRCPIKAQDPLCRLFAVIKDSRSKLVAPDYNLTAHVNCLRNDPRLAPFRQSTITANPKNPSQLTLGACLLLRDIGTIRRLKEWIAYHRLVHHYDRFFVYLNEEYNDETMSPHIPVHLPYVHYTPANLGRKRSKERRFFYQVAIEDDCLNKCRSAGVHFCTFHDVDEFMQVVATNGTAPKPLREILWPHYGNKKVSSVFVFMYYFKRNPETISTSLALDAVERAKEPILDGRNKNFDKPNQIDYRFVHKILNGRGDPFRSDPVNQIRMNHYRDRSPYKSDQPAMVIDTSARDLYKEAVLEMMSRME